MKYRFPIRVLISGLLSYPVFADVIFAADTNTRILKAEDASPSGGWKKIRHPMAGNGAYMSNLSEDGQNTLEFEFKSKGPTSIRIWPVWWMNSEEKISVRSPKTLPYFKHQYTWPAAFPNRTDLNPNRLMIKRRPGPDRISIFKDRLYFTAPESGRIGIVDVSSEEIIGHIETDGYPADMVLDEDSGLLFVADAQMNRVDVPPTTVPVQTS